MKEKVVSRRVAFELGTICIVLLAALIGVFAYDTMLLRQRADRNIELEKSLQEAENQKYTLQNQLNRSNSYTIQLETWLQETKDAKSSLQNQMDNYIANHHQTDSEYNLFQSIVNLKEEQPILDQYTLSTDPNTHSYVTSFQTNYAGYLELSMASTTVNAFVIVEFGFKDQLFSVQKTMGTESTAYFCILPPGAAIYVGNTNSDASATHTVTATYHY